MSTNDVLWFAFLKMYHEDHANAAMHCATVRYSPLTFRLAEALDALEVQHSNEVLIELHTVLLDLHTYAEDHGR